MMYNKDEDENAMHNTVVLFSTSDKFTLKQVRDIYSSGNLQHRRKTFAFNSLTRKSLKAQQYGKKTKS